MENCAPTETCKTSLDCELKNILGIKQICLAKLRHKRWTTVKVCVSITRILDFNSEVFRVNCGL